jgi:1-acyl-sn-glycerol-3-phosphate acyltransferase
VGSGEDPERGFRVEGLFYFALDAENPCEPRRSQGSQVAGDCYARGRPPIRVPLSIGGQMGAAALELLTLPTPTREEQAQDAARSARSFYTEVTSDETAPSLPSSDSNTVG